MRSLLPLLAASMIVAVVPAAAQSSYRASLAAPASATKVVARETLWNCAGADCRAPRSGLSTDMAECRAMTKKLGRVAAFWAGERAFTAADIDRCNGAAGATTTVAQAQ